MISVVFPTLIFLLFYELLLSLRKDFPTSTPALRTEYFHLKNGEGRSCASSSVFAESHQGREDKNLWDLPSSVSLVKDSLLLVPNVLSGNDVPIQWWLPLQQKCYEMSLI